MKMSVALLQYARYHGLARDIQQFDMFDLIQTAKQSFTPSKNIFEQEDDFIVLEDVFKKARDEMSLALEERPSLTLRDAHFLQNAIKTPLGPQLTQSAQWYLPNHRRMSHLKMKEPLLLLRKGDASSDYRLIKNGLDVQIMLKKLEQECSLMKEHNLDSLRVKSQEWLEIFRRNTSLMNQEFGKQKLEVARNDIARLQSILTIPKPQFEYFLPKRNKSHPSCQLKGEEHGIEVDEDYVSELQDDDISVSPDTCSTKVTPVQSNDFECSLLVTNQKHPGLIPFLPTGHNQYDGKFVQLSSTAKGFKNEHDQDKEIEQVFSPTHIPDESQDRYQIDNSTLSQKQLMTFLQARQNTATSLHEPQCNEQAENSSDEQLPVSSSSTSVPLEKDFVTLVTKITDGTQSQPLPRSLSDIQSIKVPVPEVASETTSWKWRPQNDKGNLVDSLLPKQGIDELLSKGERILGDKDDQPFPIPDSDELLQEGIVLCADFLEIENPKPQRAMDSSELLRTSIRLHSVPPISIGEFDYETDESEEFTPTMSCGNIVSVEPSSIVPKSPMPVSHDHQTDIGSITKPKEQPCQSSSPSIMLCNSKHRIQDFGQKRKSRHEAFSASASLLTFLDLRGQKFKDVGLATRHPSGEQEEDPIQSSQGSDDRNVDPDLCASDVQREHPISSNSKLRRQIFIPEIGRLRQLCGIVINNSLLHTHCPLVSFLISQQEQGLTLIYRENTQVENCMPDMILNPTTSILITDSQSLTQRALPGQKLPDQTLLGHRIQKLIPSFTTIHLLILHKEERGTNPDSNLNHISPKLDFQPRITTFCAGFNLPSDNFEIKPIWIPYHVDVERRKALEAHVWVLINKFALALNMKMKMTMKARPNNARTKLCDGEPAENKDTNLLMQEETEAEQILVEAGLNWMAAQVVLSTYSLHDIVQMSLEERMDMLSCVIGVKAIECINRALSTSKGIT